MKLIKPNLIILLSSLLSISAFCVAFYVSWTDRTTRLKGDLQKVQIVKINTSKFALFAIVSIDEKMLSAGSIGNNVSEGDSIWVRYMPEKHNVVQERVNPNRYYLFFAIEVIFLIVGIALFIESLKGKSIWTYV